jgi:protein O-GlcNAc transferase
MNMSDAGARAQAEALNRAGNAQKAQGDLPGATERYRRALQLTPDYASARYNLGLILHDTGAYEEAEACFRSLYQLDGRDADVLIHLGALLYRRGALEEAERMYRLALELRPEDPHVWLLLGKVCRETPAKMDEAASCLAHSIGLRPEGEAHNILGNLCQDQGRLDEAIGHYREATRLAPDDAMAPNNLGCALVRKGNLDEAIRLFRRVIRLQPEFADGHFNLGSAYSLQGLHAEALRCYREALRLRPEDASYRGNLLFAMQQVCEWSEFQQLCALQRRSVFDPRVRQSPFNFLSIPSTRLEQLHCARNFAAQLEQAVAADRRRLNFEFRPPAGVKPKLRIGYLSADFHEHATAYWTAELFELHDRSRLEIVAYSYGPDDRSPMRARLCRAFDRFVDLTALSHADAAARIFADGVDILVDLKGYTQNARTEIVALRPAPIQVSFVGFPATSGAGFIDYLIADRFVAPEEHAAEYSEELIWIPGSYQVNDRKRAVGETPSRRELGLPESGFVFCCFNQTYKILPDVFATWMRILRAVPDSVLWLLQWNEQAVLNLRREASANGIDPGRLIFGPLLPLSRHLGRLRAADLLLDTAPYNAHTISSDALWVGVPVLTCPGETFAARVAGSQLRALEVPELIADSMAQYEALAVRLAHAPAEVAGIRQKIERNRSSTALFDTPAFTRNLEDAYRKMWERYMAGAGRNRK